MKTKHFSHFHIAGFTYYEGATVFNELKIGTELRLVLEPENKYDPNAVAIYYKDTHLGYVPRNNNSEISKILEMGHEIFGARIQQINQQANPENQIGVMVYVKEKGE